MAKLKSVLGYTVAALSIPLLLAAMAVWAVFTELPGQLAVQAGLKTSPNWTGAEVVQTIGHGVYQTEVHRPVFDALIGEHKKGFIQVAWRPADGLPARIDEEIDVDADGQADFRIDLDTATRQASVTPHSPNVLELRGVYDLGETLAIRVTLKNPRR